MAPLPISELIKHSGRLFGVEAWVAVGALNNAVGPMEPSDAADLITAFLNAPPPIVPPPPSPIPEGYVWTIVDGKPAWVEPTGGTTEALLQIVPVSVNFTVEADKIHCRYQAAGAGAIVCRLPPNDEVAIPVGATYEIARRGLGSVTIAGGGAATVSGMQTTFADGVIINSEAAYREVAEPGTSVSVLKVATNEWDLGGALK